MDEVVLSEETNIQGVADNLDLQTLVNRLKEAGLSTKRFMKIHENKKAFEPKWEDNPHDIEDLPNYPRWGVSGREGLVLIDTDNADMADILKKILPDTFETRSPRRQLPHLYYSVYGGAVPNKLLYMIGGSDGCGEIRAQNQYLVAPGTTIKYKDLVTKEDKTGTYTILNNRPIAKIEYTVFMRIISPYLKGDSDESQRVTPEEMRDGVDAGERHAKGIRYATYLVGHLGLSNDEALKQLTDWNLKNRPPMETKDLKRMIKDAMRYVKNHPNPQKDTPEKTSFPDLDYGSHEELFNEVKGFLEIHLDLVEDVYYDILTAKVFETWLIEKFDTVGYVLFTGPIRSGKTRALEALATICRHSKLAATMSGAVIPRYLDAEENRDVSLFIDEVGQYFEGSDRSTMLAVINAGYRRGLKAIINVQNGSGWEPTELECFCPKFLAGSEEVSRALNSRCLIIPMMKNIKRMPLKIDETRALNLRRKLERYAKDMEKQPIPDAETLFRDLEIRDNRLIEITINLAALSPPIPRSKILRYAKEQNDILDEEDNLSFYADLSVALETAFTKHGKNGKVGVQTIADSYNTGRDEEERLTGKALGTHLNILGFNKKCRMGDGKIGRYVDSKLLRRARNRYNPQTTIKSEETEQSEDALRTGRDATLNPLPIMKAIPHHTLSSDTSDSSEKELCVDCKRPIIDGSALWWKGTERVCRSCWRTRKLKEDHPAYKDPILDPVDTDPPEKEIPA